MRSDLSLYGVGSYLIEVRATFTPGRQVDSLPAWFGREFVQALELSLELLTARAVAAKLESPRT